VKKYLPLIALAAMTATPAMAQDADKNPVSVSLTAGTLGAGGEVGYRVSDHIGVRGNATFFSIGADFDSDDLRYQGDVKLNSFGAMVDIYPFGGSFRVSGGARINNNKVDVSSTATGPVEIGGNRYTPEEIGTLSSGADFKSFSPALTLGFGGNNRKGFVINADAGVLFQGAAKLRPLQSTGLLADNADLMDDLEAERLSLQDDVDKIKVYPILQIGVGYRF
jgi:hypothetical protein